MVTCACAILAEDMVQRDFPGTAASGGRFSFRAKGARLAKPATAKARSDPDRPRIRSTTVMCVRRGDRVVMAADGQVTLGER